MTRHAPALSSHLSPVLSSSPSRPFPFPFPLPITHRHSSTGKSKDPAAGLVVHGVSRRPPEAAA
jgi:hypothetical protein